MKQITSSILANTPINHDFLELAFTWDIEPPLPGQFLTIRVSDSSVPLLRRPFAFSGFDLDTGTASIIYQKRGVATELLAGKLKEDTLDIIGPLGKPFPVEGAEKCILVAGGVGIGPILFLADFLTKMGREILFVFGCRTSSLVPDLQTFTNLNPVICTDDGSCGFKGTTADYLKTVGPQGNATVYGCGPMPMLRACHEFAKVNRCKCWVSVEQVMACGVGACMGCVVKTNTGYARACKEGPVFNSNDLLWD